MSLLLFTSKLVNHEPNSISLVALINFSVSTFSSSSSVLKSNSLKASVKGKKP